MQQVYINNKVFQTASLHSQEAPKILGSIPHLQQGFQALEVVSPEGKLHLLVQWFCDMDQQTATLL